MRFIALLLLLPVLASADPGPATRYLINEPASLMDVGIGRGRYVFQGMQSHLEEVIRSHAGESSVDQIDTMFYYHFGEDQIVISIGIIMTEGTITAEPCKAAIATLRRTVGDGYQSWFSHSDYTTGREPKDFAEQLKQRFSFICTTVDSLWNVLEPRIVVKASLSDDTFFIAEEPKD